MNIYELNELIAHPEVQKDKKMLASYKRINESIVYKNTENN